MFFQPHPLEFNSIIQCMYQPWQHCVSSSCKATAKLGDMLRVTLYQASVTLRVDLAVATNFVEATKFSEVAKLRDVGRGDMSRKTMPRRVHNRHVSAAII